MTKKKNIKNDASNKLNLSVTIFHNMIVFYEGVLTFNYDLLFDLPSNRSLGQRGYKIKAKSLYVTQVDVSMHSWYFPNVDVFRFIANVSIFLI